MLSNRVGCFTKLLQPSPYVSPNMSQLVIPTVTLYLTDSLVVANLLPVDWGKVYILNIRAASTDASSATSLDVFGASPLDLVNATRYSQVSQCIQHRFSVC